MLYAGAKVKSYNGVWVLMIPVCPICGSRHQHETNLSVSSSENPRNYMGEKLSNCRNPRVKENYCLVEIQDE